MDNAHTKNGAIVKSSVLIGHFTYGIESLMIKQWNEGAAINIRDFCSIANNVKFMLGGNYTSDWMTNSIFGHISQKELINDELLKLQWWDLDIEIIQKSRFVCLPSS